MKRTTLYDKTEKVGITLPISLVKQTDKARHEVHSFEEQYIRGKGGQIQEPIDQAKLAKAPSPFMLCG